MIPAMFQNIEFIASASMFIALMLLFYGLWQYLEGRRNRKRLLGKIDQAASRGDIYPVHPVGINSGDEDSPYMSFLSGFGRLVRSDTAGEESRLKFLKAGIRRKNAAEIFWGAKIFFCMGIPVIFLITRLTVFEITNSLATVMIMVACALAGFYLPDLWLTIKTTRRRDKLLEALPDALDLLVVCVEAGMGLDGAIARVAEEIHLNSPELGDELMQMNRELRAGKSRQDALRDLAQRSDIDAMNSLVTLLIQTDQFGTSIATALKVFSDSYRTQRYQKAEETAAKIPIKLVFPLVLFIFPSLFVTILGGAVIRIWQNIIMK